MKKWEYFNVYKTLEEGKSKGSGVVGKVFGESYKKKKWVIWFFSKEEKKIKEFDNEYLRDLFNSFGKEGWELVSVDSHVNSDFDLIVDKTLIFVDRIEYIFKRELLEEGDDVLHETTYEEFLKRPGGNMPPRL